MKRIYSPLMLAGVFILALVSLNLAFGQTITVSPATQTLNRGDEYVFGLNIAGVTNVQGSSIDIAFTNPGLEYLGATASSSFFPSGSQFIATPAGSTVSSVTVDQALLSGTPLTGGGTLFTVRFRAVNAGTYPLSVTARVRNNLNQNIPVTVTGATITVTKTSTSLTTGTASGTFGGSTALTATLTAGATGVAGKVITFSLNGTPVGSATTNASGVATLASASLVGISAGTYPAGVSASFAEDANYFASNASVQLTVGKATGVVTLGNLNQIYDGTSRVATAITTPPGLALTLTYDGSATPPTNAGSYAVVGTIVDANYDGTGNGTLDVGKASATLTFGPTTFVYDGSPKPVSVTTTPASITGVVVTYDGSATVPTNAAQYALQATLTNQNYEATPIMGTLTIQTASTTTTLISSVEPGVAGAPVVFTATVAPSAADGNVQFFDGATSLGTAPLNGSNQAALSTSSLSVGSHTIKAVYLGLGNYAGSESATLPQSIVPATYLITASAGANGSITPSGAVMVNYQENQSFTIAPATGYHIADVLVDGVSVGVVANYTFSNVVATHSIQATFAINTYPITATAGPNGTVTPSGTVNVNHGTSQLFTITPATGYHTVDVLLDGVTAGPLASYMFTNVTGPHTISATFAIDQFTITASAGANGAISPNGPQTVNYGTNQSFTITPATGFHVTDVLVDGVSVGAVTAYTFSNVTANHTITASFAINTFTLTTTAVNGSITRSPNAASYDFNTVVQLTAVPATGYHFTGWTGDLTGLTNPSPVTMDGNKTVQATFAIDQFTITASAGANGVISPNGPQTVNYGTNQSFTITPATGHHVADVLVDGVSVGAVTAYTFSNVTANHAIAASFAINTYTLTVGGANGTVTKNPDQASYDHGTVVHVTATPATGYHFVGWTGDATGASNPLDLTMDASKNIQATFEIDQFTITASAGANGSISPSGAVPASFGATQAFTVTPATGYHVADVLVDGASVGAVAAYTFSNIAANHTIAASFAINTYTLTVGGTNGAVTKNPDQATYNHGSTVQLTPVPTAGYHFTGWSGDATGTANPLTVTMDANKTIQATFAIDQFTITASAGTGGAISPSGAVNVNYGASQSFSITPSAGYHVVDVIVDGVSAGPIASYLFTNVNAVHSISATFAIDQFVITASTGSNGAISPNGAQTVNYGTNQTFTITPATGYHVADVLVDGASVGAVAAYTFSNIAANHTIAASFAINTYTLTVGGTNGTVTKSPDQAAYNHGVTVQLTPVPATGYHFTGWTGDATGTEVPLAVTMDGNKNIQATFAIDQFTITASAGANGAISPNGPQTVNYGTNQSFTITPATGYHVADVLVDGSSVGAVTAYTFTNVTANHTIVASFAINTYTLTVGGTNGSVTKNPDQATYNHGVTVQLTPVPAIGYHFTGWTGDATGTANPLTVTMDANRNIQATFALDAFTITASAGANGSISPSGTVPASFGATQAFTITPATGYHVADVLVDGSSVGAVTAYTFTNVTANHTIAATFAINTYTLTVGGTNGSVTRNPDQATYNYNTAVQVTAVPATGYHFAGWTGDASGTTNPLTVTMDVNKNIQATFALDAFTITASAGANGSITPNGVVNVSYGANQLFTITPATGYHVADVLVDGSSVGALAAYTFSNVAGNHTIVASFAINTYTLTVGGTNGSVTRNPDQATYNYNASVQVTAVPATGYHFTGWTGDAAGTTNPLTVTMDGNKSITATFAIDQLTIAASAGTGGTISPNGTVNVNYGANQTFTITPSTGYHITNVVVDGFPAGALTSYLFTNVTTNHTIAASFAINTYTLSASGANGSVTKSPDQATYDHGTIVQLTAVAAPGYHFTGWTGDATGTTNPLNITMDGNKTVTATFAQSSYTLTVNAVNGSITKNPDQPDYVYGTVVSLTAVPVTGYHFTGWSGDLTGSTNPGSITMNGDRTVTASFAIDQFTIAASAGANGAISPSGAVAVNYGSNQSFTITPATGYHVADVLVDGASVGTVTNFTFTTVTAPHTIAATFAINSYTITATAGDNGSISPSGSVVVNHNGTPSFTATGTTNYHLGALLVDGVPVNPVSPYVFAPVTANHSILARFAQTQYTLSGPQVLRLDTDGDGVVDMIMTFTTVPHGTWHVSVYAYLAAPASEPASPGGALASYLKVVTDLPAHSYHVNVKKDMAGVASFGSLSNLASYHATMPAGWVLVPSTYAASDVEWAHPTLLYTTDDLANVTMLNGASKGLFVSRGSATATAGTVFPNSSWDHTGFAAGDWRWTGAQTFSFYLVPAADAVFNAATITLEWDPAVISYTGTDFTSGLFGSGTATVDGTSRVTVHVTGASDITVNPINHIARVDFTLLKPGHSALAIVQSAFSKANAEQVLMVANQGDIRTYLGDVANVTDVTTGNGEIDYDDLVPWSLSYWSGVPSYPGGMSAYKRKFDIGPTTDNSAFSLPVPDNRIDFEDLMIFSMAYGQTLAHHLPKVAISGTDPLEVSLGAPIVSGNETRIPVSLAGRVTDVRAMRLEIGGQFGGFLGAEKADLLVKYETPVALFSRSEGSHVYVDFAVVGVSTPGVEQSGDVVWLRFEGRPMVKLLGTEARTSVNTPQEVLKKKGAGELAPTAFALAQNYPNPFNPSTTIAFDLPVVSSVSLEIFNVLGEKVATLVDEVRDAGTYQVVWDGRDDSRRQVASGVYVYRVRAGEFTGVKKMLLLK